MVHFLIAKLFFILFSVCCLNINAGAPSASVSCADIGNARYLQLNCSGDSSLAIFSLRGKWYMVWDIGASAPDLLLPKPAECPAGFLSIEQIKNVKSSRPCIIFSLDISTEMIPMIMKTEKGWVLNAISVHLIKNDPNPNQVAFDHQDLGRFRILNTGNASSVKLDMPTGEELNIIPTNQPDTGLDALESDYVDVYESVQGVCLYFKSDQIILEKQGKDTAYYPARNPMLPSQKCLEGRVTLKPDLTFIRFGDFTSEFRFLLADKALRNKKNRSLHLLRQAWVELALCEGEESKQTILLLGKEVPKFKRSLFCQLILGYAQFLSQDYQESLKTLEQLPNVSEIDFWRNLSKSQLGEKVVFGEESVFILQNYPLNLRDYILVKLVPYMFETQQMKLVKLIQDSISPQSELAKAVMGFYHAMYVFACEDKDEGCKLLDSIAKNAMNYSVPNEFQTEARLETYLYKHGGAPIDDIIKELDMLRMQSRGNDIEVKICLKLIEKLEKKNNLVKIIEILQDLVQRFKKFDATLGLNQLLKNYVEKFFMLENESVSPVKIIGLFRKYKATIEHHPNYEKIVERVAYQYERLDLLDQEAELLTELFQKTSNNEKKIEWQLKVGGLYVQNAKPEEAIALLSKIFHSIEGEQQKRAGSILARADFMRKNHLETIKWLKHHPTKENKRVIADVYIAMEGYANVVDSLKDYLSSLKEKEDDVLKETALVQLAAAYYMQKEYANLATLHDTHKDFMKARKSYKNFAMLCRSRAEDLKTSQEVREYINDADVLKEIFDKAKVSVG
jgi:hypothetical protein